MPIPDPLHSTTRPLTLNPFSMPLCDHKPDNSRQHVLFQVQRRKSQLLREREQLETERARWSSKLSYLEETVLAGAGKSLGMFTLEVRGAHCNYWTQETKDQKCRHLNKPRPQVTDNAVVVTSRLVGPRLLAAAVGGAEKQPRGGRSRD
jgi:hypothetical protein